MQKRHSDREQYFEEQAHTTSKYYIPYLETHFKVFPCNVLEVGCGEGGNLLPFVQKNCNVFGIDISASRIAQANYFFKKRNLKGKFITADIFQLKGFQYRFQLIIVHDVIEHILDKTHLMRQLKTMLAPGGIIFISFPPWQMPFGGHQQIAKGKVISHFPFLHLFPSSLYRLILRTTGEGKDTIQELLSIKKCRCSIEQFLKIVRISNYKVVDHQFYFINPHYETKFGLIPRKLNRWIGCIPYVRNLFTTSCFFILQSCPEVKATK